MFSSDNKKLKEINTTNVATIIGEGTIFTGDIVYTGGLHIDGKVIGNVSAAEQRVQLIANSRITGNVKYNLIEMEVGAEVNGQLLRQQAEPIGKKTRPPSKDT